ncbi:MAG: dephospho-CoA kinase [Muribaculaceae bacterium]|nr:dephospho-CoA kinase [Muribaculaceae bacterium]
MSPLSVSSDGIIDRRHISSVVFSDKSKLEQLNSIVHTAVRQRIIEWRAEPHKSDRLFVETAILYQSGLDALVDEVWDVIAPDEIRIMRVINRNKCDRSAVIDRIKSQSFLPENPHPIISTIVNDGFTAVIPQILDLLK